MAYTPGELDNLGIPAGIFDLMKNDYLREPPEADRKKTPAKSAQEFSEKYGGKRYTAKDAGKAHLLNLLYHAYQTSGKPLERPLFDVYTLRSRIQTEEDMRRYDSYYYLTEWLRSLYENAMAIDKDLTLRLSEYDEMASSLLSAENIRSRIQGEQSTELIIWLNTLTLEAYQPQEPGGLLMQSLRDNIGQGIRYIKAYHAFLDEVAEATGIPECSALKVSAPPIVRRLGALNVTLKYIRDSVAEHREPEVREAEASAPPPEERDGIKFPQTLPYLSLTTTSWTPDYLSATMRSFEPIGAEPPVPEERIKFLRDSLRRDFKKTFIDWYGLYYDYSIDYRKPRPAARPPEPQIDIEIAEAKAHEG